jgi:transketolase
MNTKALDAVAMSVRSLSMDAIQKANSGHPGLPLGCAELGALLYGEMLKHDPADPEWIDRDRFVLSAGHGSMFLYSMLHLSGYPVTMEDIKSFRQVGSKCAGHPEFGLIKGIESTSGPLGQGIATAVGMAIAETMLAARFNTAKAKIIDHYTYVLSGDGCLMEGVSGEAASLAGHLGLGKLIVFYDSNSITIDGSTGIAFTEDVPARYRAYGWQTYEGSMYDYEGIMALVAKAKADPTRPALIKLTSIIGKGSPSKQGTHGVHGSPLGADEIVLAHKALGVPDGETFYVHPEAVKFFETRKKALKDAHASWKKGFDAWAKENPALKTDLDAFYAGKPTSPLQLPQFKEGDKIASRNASGTTITALASAYTSLVGGSADLTGPNCTQMPKEAGVYSKTNRMGRMVHFGIREFAMAAISNGISLHGGLTPFCATFLVFSDYLRPALRLSALMNQGVVYVLTHDSIYVGEDGPTHQPVEHISSLRAIPNVRVLRPGDAEETVVAWEMALERKDGPTVLALSRNNLTVFKKDDANWKDTIRCGAYVARRPASAPDLVIVATGSEVNLALDAAARITDKKVMVISMISRELFYAQNERIRNTLLPSGVRTVVVEAGIPMGWERIAKPEDILSIDRFGESGPGDKVAVHLGLTVDHILAIINRK